MRWDLEELTEDAVVSYLKQKLPGEMRVYAAHSFNEQQFPCAVVIFDEAEPISEPAAHADPVMLGGSVAVLTEYAPTLDASGNVVETPRERNRAARSAVLDALAVSDLNAQLIAQGVEAVAFSMAQLLPGRRREHDADKKALITVMPIGVIAEPVTGS